MLARSLKFLLLLLVIIAPASAAPMDWTGFAGTSGNPADQKASVPGNWNPASVPVNGDTVTIQFCQGWELLGQSGLEWDINITPYSLTIDTMPCNGVVIVANANWLKATNRIDIDMPAYLSAYNIDTPVLDVNPLLVAQPLAPDPMTYTTIQINGDQKINSGDDWDVIDLLMTGSYTLENDGDFVLCNINPVTSYDTPASNGTIAMIQDDRCINAPPVCGLAGEINATGFPTASGITNDYLPFSTNLQLGVNSRGTVNGTCDITGQYNYSKSLSLVFYENNSLGSVFTTPNFDVDYDGNYSAYCSGAISINTSIMCNDTYAFTIDRSEYPDQKGLTTGAVLLFSILFAALFTGIGLMINSTPMKILMYMFGISAGIMGINYSHLALREWVKVPALIGVVETFSFLANWTYYFIIAVLLVMIIVWAINSLNDDPEDDIEFMN